MSQPSSRRSSSQEIVKIRHYSDDEDDSAGRYSDKSCLSAKHRWSRRKQHPLSSRFGKDAFLPCVVLMKKGRSSPPVTVSVMNIGLRNTSPKSSGSKDMNRRASLGVIKERGDGADDAGTWAKHAQRRRTSLPTAFHSSRKQTVMSSVLVESSEIAELHMVLDKLTVASSGAEAQILTEQMQTILQPYKRVNNRRQEINPDNLWTTTTSATGLPSQDLPVKSTRLPIIKKTPSSTPHDSRCSSPTGGKELGNLSMRRRTIHGTGTLNSPARSASFFSQDDLSKDSKDRKAFASSDYESCDNLLTDGSEGETVKQMPDLQQPNARRGGNVETISHEQIEQNSKIRKLITEPTINEDEEETSLSSSASPSEEDVAEMGQKSSSTESLNGEIRPEDLQRVFGGVVYQTELLDKVYDWNFPIFELADSTHCVLSQMAYKLFDDTGLFESFNIPRKPFVEYMRALENGYRNIPYSDSGTVHTQVNTVGTGSLAQAIPALELMALYLAAAMHDYDHPGRTNAFLVETRHPLAMLYNDRSVLENHHASASWELLHSKPAYNFLVNLDLAEWKRLRFLIVDAILATDLKKHFELMGRFSSKVTLQTDTSSENAETPRYDSALDWSVDEDRLLVCQMIIKLADIGGPTKVRDLHVTWTRAICQEFFMQGDEERQLNSPVSPFMDRKKPQVAQLQRTFIRNLIAPLVCNMHRARILAGLIMDQDGADVDNILDPSEECLQIDCRSVIREQLADNLRYWNSILQREMDGNEEMEEVFSCCHQMKLEHGLMSMPDVDFPKKLRESRRARLHSPLDTKCNLTEGKKS